jgi:HemY protein
MRRLLVAFVVALVVGGAVGTLMVRDPGYVLITYDDMSFETSVWFALLALLVGYFALRFVFGVAARIARGGAGIAAWQQNRRARVAQARTTRGLLLVGEGDWVGGRKALLADAKDLEAPWANYVAAARAANELGDAGDRDTLIEKAVASTPGSEFAAAMTRAELQMDALQYRDAVATLLKAQQDAPSQPRLLQLLATSYERLADWEALIALAPQLQRRGVQSPDAMRAATRRWWLAYFDQPAATSTTLVERWNSADKDLRNDAQLIGAFARAAARAGAIGEAETALSKSIAREWNPDLVALYGRIVDRADRQLATAEGWLKAHPNDPVLLLALGRLATANRDWSKAREYFEASLKQQRSAEVYGELGRLCLALGERPRASELLAQGLELSGQLPPLPMPTGDGSPAS